MNLEVDIDGITGEAVSSGSASWPLASGSFAASLHGLVRKATKPQIITEEVKHAGCEA